MKIFRRNHYAQILFLSGFLLASFLHASTATTNCVPAADAAMRETDPDGNSGTSTTLPVGTSKGGSPRNHGLFRFDLSAIPTDAVITSASLRITVVNSGTSPANFGLYRLLNDWAETDVTWNVRLPSTPWNVGGGEAGTDFVSNPSATNLLTDAGTFTDFSSTELVADVQQWVNNPATNFGWMFIAVGEPAGSGKIVASREDDGNTPVLTIEYTVVVPSAAPTVLTNAAVAGNQFRFTFNVESNRTYAVEFVGSLPETNWTALTNIPALPAGTTLSITDTVTISNRFYRVRTP